MLLILFPDPEEVSFSPTCLALDMTTLVLFWVVCA
jgi:hypothetical protein